MPNCPECERPMRISVLRLHGPRSRKWSCPNSGCGKMVHIEDHDIIPIESMVEAMAASLFFNDSDKHLKKQAKYRRIAGGINSLLNEKLGNDTDYLTNDNIESLKEASRLLERLASAAERSKKELKNLELIEKHRVLDRAAKATQLITAHFQSEDLITKTQNTIIMLLIADNYYSSLPIRTYDIESAIKRAEDWNKDVTEELTTFLNGEFKDACQRLGSYFSHGHEPIDELVNKSIEKSIEKRDVCLKPSLDVLNMIDHQLKIEASKNVVSLKLVPKT